MSNSHSNIGFGRDVNEFLQELSSKTILCENTSEGNEKIGIFVTAIENKDNGKCQIFVSVRGVAGSEEHKFLILPQFVQSLSLSCGEIDGETLSSIEHFADVTKAFYSARASLDYTVGSLRALERKLVIKGFSKKIAADAVATLADMGCVNESEIAESRARVFIRKRWGKIRIFAKLREEGFSEICLDGVREYLSEIDFEDLCAEHIEKKYGEIPNDRREIEKIYAALSRYGYSGSEICSAIKKISK